MELGSGLGKPTLLILSNLTPILMDRLHRHNQGILIVLAGSVKLLNRERLLCTINNDAMNNEKIESLMITVSLE
jgi:hypothetical protein